MITWVWEGRLEEVGAATPKTYGCLQETTTTDGEANGTHLASEDGRMHVQGR
jgi:hypothetical protein